MTIAQEFAKLAERFERIASRDDGLLDEMDAAEKGAKLLKRADAEGLVDLPNVQWPAAGDKSLEIRWHAVWIVLVSELCKQMPDDLPTNPNAWKTTNGDGKISKGVDWKRRVEQYADVCRWLAKYFETATRGPVVELQKHLRSRDAGALVDFVDLIAKRPGIQCTQVKNTLKLDEDLLKDRVTRTRKAIESCRLPLVLKREKRTLELVKR